MGAHARVLARACMCAAQALPNEPTHAGNGSPVPELPNYRTSQRARGHPPCRALFTEKFDRVVLNIVRMRACGKDSTVSLKSEL